MRRVPLSNPCLVAPALAAAAPAAVATNVLLTVSLTLPLWTTVTCQETARSPGGLQCLKKFHPKVRNHGDGPYYGHLLVESGYYCFHI